MITAILPCFNAEKYLGDAIASVQRQTRAVDQIIVVDDCSTDASPAIALHHGVTLLTTPRNSGHAAARNLGIEAAEADLIAWLDADDYWEPNHIETVVGLLERCPTAAVAFSAIRFVGEGAGGVWRRPSDGVPANLFWESVGGTVVPAMSAVTRREPLVAVGGFDSSIRVSPDFDLWLRLSRRNLFVSTEEVTSNYRRHGVQISSRPERQLESVYQSRWRYLQTALRVDDEAFCEAFRQRMTSIWDADLLAAWHARDVRRLKALLKMRRYMPCSTETARKLRWKARVPKSVLLAWDSIS